MLIIRTHFPQRKSHTRQQDEDNINATGILQMYTRIKNTPQNSSLQNVRKGHINTNRPKLMRRKRKIHHGLIDAYLPDDEASWRREGLH